MFETGGSFGVFQDFSEDTQHFGALLNQRVTFAAAWFFNWFVELAVPHIIVDDMQARIISESPGSIEIRDPRGRHLGYIVHGFTEDDIAIAKDRLASDEPRLTTQQVMEHLRTIAQQ